MLNLLSVDDAARALHLAVHARGSGLYNIPGRDTLPLSRVIALAGRADVAVPGPLLEPLYRLRHLVTGFSFRYDLNAHRFHFTGLLDGEVAARELGYRPATAIAWSACAANRSLSRGTATSWPAAAYWPARRWRRALRGAPAARTD
jgi:hypothetical protein